MAVSAVTPALLPWPGYRPDGPGLIGAEDVEPPYWARIDESVAGARGWTMLRAAPRVFVTVARRSWRAAPALTALVAALQLVSGAITAFGLLATADVFTQLLAAGPTPERLVAALPALALVTAAYATGALVDAADGLAQASLTPRIERDAQDEFHTAVAGLDVVAFDDADFVELMSRASGSGLPRLSHATTGAADLLSSLVSVVAATVTATVLHPLLAPAALLAVLPQGWATVRSARLSYTSFLRSSSRMRRLGVTARMLTSRADAAEIRAFTAQEVLLGEHRRITASLTAEALGLARSTTGVRLVGRALSGVGTAAAYGTVFLLVSGGLLPLALAASAALALRAARSSVSTGVFSANRLYEASFYLDLYERFLRDAAERTRRAEGDLPAGAPATIELDDVGFSYPGQDRPALSGVSFTLRAGDTVALVGENGSGKSTLAKLITGLYLPGHGTVRWDGVDIASVAPRALHDRVAVVLQNPAEWPTTAAHNVRIGRIHRPDPDGSALVDAAARSGADEVVAELPDGWRTVLSRAFQRGRDLSGGQWQRVSVARGLYRDAPLVIADEPTAAMDARAEQTVFTHLHGLGGQGRITVLVTHRLANVRHADLIVVLRHGVVVEAGSHDELTAAGGEYAELFDVQAAAYRDGARHPRAEAG